MSEFIFTKKPFTTMVDVWYDRIMIGEMSMEIKENPEIDTEGFGSSRTCIYRSYSSYGLTCIGEFESKEAAAQSILEEHRKSFNKRYSVGEPCLTKL